MAGWIDYFEPDIREEGHIYSCWHDDLFDDFDQEEPSNKKQNTRHTRSELMDDDPRSFYDSNY